MACRTAHGVADSMAWWRGGVVTMPRRVRCSSAGSSPAARPACVQSKMCLFLLASTALDTNDPARASALAEESLAVALAISHRIGNAMARLVLGRPAYHRLGNATAMLLVQHSEAAYEAGRRLSLDTAFREALRHEVLP